MKKASFAGWLLIVALIIPGAISLFNRGAKAVTVQVNVKDLPAHGLRMIAPSDPSYGDQMRAFSKSRQNSLVESLKPFSVLLKNLGDKAIAGYWLKWELAKLDGTIVTRESGGINPRVLMDGGAPGQESLSFSSGYAIRPNSIQFVSPVISLGEDQSGSIAAFGGGYVEQGNLEQVKQAAQTRNLNLMLDTIAAEFHSYASITVSLDGAFFEDGTFIGPDKTNFFMKVQAQIDAKRDLLDEVAFAIKRNDSEDEIFTYIEEVATDQPTVSGSRFTPTDYYNLHKKTYAEEILRMRDAMNGTKAIAMSLQTLRKPWPKLKKK